MKDAEPTAKSLASDEVLHGIGGSPFIALGRVRLLDRRAVKVPRYHIRAADVDYELERLTRAFSESERQLEQYRSRMHEAGGTEGSAILKAHLLMLRDEQLGEGCRNRVQAELLNAEWAVRRTVRELRAAFEDLDDEYFRERRHDVDFLGERLIRNLMGKRVDPFKGVESAAIIAAHDLSPGDMAAMSRHRVQGFATDLGARTSHTVIMANALEIAAVVGLEAFTEKVGDGDIIVVDGIGGLVILRPSDATIAEYTRRQAVRTAFERSLLRDRELPATTGDGTIVELRANIELTEEIASAVDHGAHGIGLFRTEFLYMDRDYPPSDEEHYLLARGAIQQCEPHPVTIRTMDLGGDKLARSVDVTHFHEENPALGIRGIRVYGLQPETFRSQVRGLYRAAAHGPLRIMLPMVSSLDELRATRWLMSEAADELREAGVPFSEDVEIGIMIEMPSAVAIADLFAKEVDFFSVGTNDLIQYALGIDRHNEHVAYLYHPLHPAILRMLRDTVRAADAAGIPVSICGEMASDPGYTQVLLGLGFRELSMNASAIPTVKWVVRESTVEESQLLAQSALECSTSAEIEAVVEEHMRERFPRLYGSRKDFGG